MNEYHAHNHELISYSTITGVWCVENSRIRSQDQDCTDSLKEKFETIMSIPLQLQTPVKW